MTADMNIGIELGRAEGERTFARTSFHRQMKNTAFTIVEKTGF
jgi:hypothetical protein